MGLDAALSRIGRAVRDGALITDPDVRASYAGDESEVTPVVPDAVLRAESADDVKVAIEACADEGVPLTPRAGGTSRVGGAVPIMGGLVLATEKLSAIKGIEREDLTCVVQPGVVTGDLHAAVEAEGLFYPPDPNSLGTCTIGGNLGCNAGGPRAFKYGVTRDFALSLEVITGAGERLRVGKPTVKGVTGYDLAGLMIGSEGTLGVITEARLRLLPKPESVATLLVFLPDDAAVGRTITGLLGRGIVPRCVELVDAIALGLMKKAAGLAIPEGARSMLLVEVDGHEAEVERQVERCGNACDDAGAVEVLAAQSSTERERLWAARRELSHTLRRSAAHKLSEDVVVPRTRIFDLLSRCRVLAETHGITMPTYGHAGDGNLHVNFLWETPDQKPSVDAAIRGLFESVVEMGGTLSGEHGIGVLKAPYLDIEQSPELIALQKRIQALFDPKGIMNPGKIFAGPRRMHGAC